MLNTIASIAPAPFVELQLRRIEAAERRLAPYKRQVFDGIDGTIVEIGPGLGLNFHYLPAGSRWIGVEPDVELHEHLQDEARDFGLHPELIAGMAEAIPVEDGTADAVIGTFVLCSVEDPDQVLQEIRRILRPGGRFAFIEHVADRDGTLRRRVQRMVRPMWHRLANGCRLDLDTQRLIRSAGFARVEIEERRLRRSLLNPHIIGWAQKDSLVPSADPANRKHG